MTVRLCGDEYCLELTRSSRRLCDAHIEREVRWLGLPPLRVVLAGLVGAPPDFDTVLALADRRARWDGLSPAQVALVKGVRPVGDTPERWGRSGDVG